MINRRNFMKLASFGVVGFITSKHLISESRMPKEFQNLASPDYDKVFHSEIEWENVSKGLDFSRVRVYRNKKLIDIIAALKIDPIHNNIKVFNGYNYKDNVEVHNIEGWQKKTGAIAMINSAQYMADPYYKPVALVICDGKQKGPKHNRYSRGMLVAEPRKDLGNKLKKIDLLEFDYDKFDYKTTPYLQGVQHWPILIDRKGKIKVKKSLWQANRTIVAKDKDDKILFLTTEGGYFTLYNFGRFLKDSNQRKNKGFNIHTAMNMDGGYEANMVVKTPKLSYITYGEFETYGPNNDATIFGLKIKIPGAIGVFPR